MSERNTKVLFRGIIESIDIILDYTSDIDFEQFKKDRKTRDAVLMQLLVLGETANRVPVNFRNILPDIEWGRIVRSRNVIAHNYHGIDYEVIWRIIAVYLPPLKISLENKLKEL